jgi:alkanesulfonate monooxygenase SsuD/methylene tetrahydromethanopterin reductase-like flavin-dependent oxidoreductase (luciferase family)
VEKYGRDTDLLPTSLISYTENRRGYDYSKHGESDNPYLDFITDDIVDGFAVLGEPQDHIAKLKALESAGITQFNIYLDNGNEEKIIADYGNTVIPAMM